MHVLTSSQNIRELARTSQHHVAVNRTTRELGMDSAKSSFEDANCPLRAVTALMLAQPSQLIRSTL
jgi:hypothetical protein